MGVGPAAQPPPDYYALLGVSPGASATAIRAAFRQLAKQLHPDISQSASTTAHFRQVVEAYETLSDPARRTQYDALYFAGAPRQAAHPAEPAPIPVAVPPAPTAAGSTGERGGPLPSPRVWPDPFGGYPAGHPAAAPPPISPAAPLWGAPPAGAAPGIPAVRPRVAPQRPPLRTAAPAGRGRDAARPAAPPPVPGATGVAPPVRPRWQAPGTGTPRGPVTPIEPVAPVTPVSRISRARAARIAAAGRQGPLPPEPCPRCGTLLPDGGSGSCPTCEQTFGTFQDNLFRAAGKART